MIDDWTYYRLLNHIAFRVFREMDEGRPLTEINVELQMDLCKKRSHRAVRAHGTVSV